MGTTRKIKIGILTSSRADFGIYLPLLQLLKKDKTFEFEIIVFGTHLSRHHGFTVNEIERLGFKIKYRIYSILLHDDAASIASSYSLTALKFADFWDTHKDEFKWVFCLGDRYEMAAAVFAGIPLGMKFAHIHGGEATLGSIDNIYRHSITLASTLHFVSLEEFKNRIKELIGEDKNCFVTGSLSLDNLTSVKYLTKREFLKRWSIDLSKSSVLVTIHPETVAYSKNEVFSEEACKALLELSSQKQLIITMPNADTNGMIWREAFQKLKRSSPNNVFLVENFGTESYFTCMKFVDYMLGNTSSGIIEAASFRKYVINLGDRQKGRISSKNVLHTPFDNKTILEKANSIKSLPELNGSNIYFRKGAASKIISILKRLN